MAWLLEFEHRPTGRDLYPVLFESMDDSETYGGDNVRFQMVEHFGRFVTGSNHHLSECLPTSGLTRRRVTTDETGL